MYDSGEREPTDSLRSFMREALCGQLAAFIAEDEQIDIIAAFSLLYSSRMFEKLQDDATLLYREGSGYLYELYREERPLLPDKAR